MAYEWVGPVATAAVGIAGFASQHLMVRRQQDVQRSLASADRLWHKRAAAYVDLLAWAGGQRNHIGTLDDNPAKLREFADRLSFPIELHAQLTAYASGTVYARAQAFLDELRENARITAVGVERVAAAKGAGENGNDALAEMYGSAAILDHTANSMARLVSDDLHGAIKDDQGRPQQTPD